MTEIRHLADVIRSSRDLTTATLRRLITRSTMTDSEHRAQVAELLEHVDPATVTHPQLRIIERHRLSVRRGLSFRTIMLQRSEAARHLGVRDRAWLLDDKLAGYRFADALGVRRPQADLTPRAIGDITPAPPMVVKPVRSTGARGVYLVMSDRRIIEPRTTTEHGSWDRVLDRAGRLMADPRRPMRDRWITEELILDGRQPARDLKFYAFYGHIVLVQEVVRLPEFLRAFWTPDGQLVETGKSNTLRGGTGPTKEQVAMVEQISAAIPAPFMRIDMLRVGKRDLVVGEFTPRPGQFEEFDAETDRWLAEEWVRAERRLLDDALAGKTFEVFETAQSNATTVGNPGD